MRNSLFKPLQIKKLIIEAYTVNSYDDFFQQWVLNSKENISAFLEILQCEYPEKFNMLIESRSVSAQVKISPNSENTDEFKEVWNRIEESITKYELFLEMQKIKHSVK